MADYQDIRGLRVKYLSADPSNTATGEVWYNSTTGTLRSHVVGAAWSSGSPMIAGVGAAAGNSGIQTAAFYAGGTPGVVTQEYNGSGWSLGGDINTSRYRLSGAGTLTAGLVFGGQNPANTAMQTATEEYDGSTWTSNPSGLNTGRAPVGSAGTQTAGLAFGGRTAFSPPYGDTTATEEYNGSAWTTSPGSLPQAKIGQSGTGTQTAALAIGGQPTPTTTTTYEYDGSTWSEGGTLNTGRYAAGAAGTQTAGLTFGGSPGGTATEDYDGSTWTTSPATLGTARETGAIGPMGTNTAALLAGSPGASVLTEEYHVSTNAITAGAWASGGALPGSGRQGYGVGTGTQTATIIAGGPPTTTQTQFYDGASWTSLASIPSGVTNSQGFGDSEELLTAGGNSAAPYSALTYVYSRPGDSWTAVSAPGNLTTARALGAGCGALSTAGIIAGGDTPSYSSATESWNGSAWTTVNSLPTVTGNAMGSCGTQTAGLAWSGQNPGDATAEETYEWDGTNWAVGGSRLIGVVGVRGGAGTQTAALTFGGWLDPGGSASTEGYDGTAWSTRPNMAAVGANNFQTGTQASALRAGGTDGPGYTVVEEFTGETSAANIETLTTS